jgi:hypothetical protein
MCSSVRLTGTEGCNGGRGGESRSIGGGLLVGVGGDEGLGGRDGVRSSGGLVGTGGVGGGRSGKA